MKIRMLCGIAGDKWSAIPGEIIDLPDAEALSLIAKNMAEAPEGVRTATKEKRETATTRKGKEKS